MPKLTASESTTMGIRLTLEQRNALERIAKQTGVEVSQLIRFAIDALIAHYKATGDRLVLPIDFSEVVRVERARQEPRKKSA